MSSSEYTTTITSQVNINSDNTAGIATKVCNSLDKKRDNYLNKHNKEKAWVKISQNASVHLKKGRPIMESTFRID